MKLSSVNLKSFLAKNGIFFALVLLVVFFTILNPRFMSTGNALNVLLQVAELGIVVLPLALLMISGSVDLSVGSIASASAVNSALVMSATGSTTLGIIAGLVFGVAAGALNGFLVAYLGLNPIVVTLGFLSVWGGYAMMVTGGRTVTRRELPEEFQEFGTAAVGPFPVRLLLLLLVVAGVWYVLNRHRVGRETYAIGGSERAARLMGVNVRRVRFGLFAATGLASALAGIMLGAKVQSVSPAVGLNLEMNALTVALLGGVAFAGGVGRVGGVLAGLLFFGVMRNGLVFLQASPFLQTIIVGLTLVVAVALDESIQKIVKQSWATRGKAVLESSIKANGDPGTLVEEGTTEAGERQRLGVGKH
ncbi:ABC transporter permease [Paeniglutamicibacter sp. ABSL32-1]|uniref:ABC transporter permease n=1 Tax=Paeniglutamicibacter quisquiliarum TaxID=2849498 RepID=UPI001C2D3DCB|nr:ABC transporter permease [Paeniglutamicibacter quisquiliarum]